jgi:O-antigen/teichoic acid export membrane protein
VTAPATGARALAGHLGWSTVGTLGSRLGGAIAGVVAAQLLGPAGRGQYAVLVAVASMAAAVATAGLQFWVVREVADPRSDAPVRAVIRRHLVRSGAIVAGVAGIGSVIAPRLGAASAGEALATGSLVLATSTALVLLAVMNGERDMRAIALATITGAVVYLGALGAQAVAERSSAASVTLAATCGQLAVIALCLRSYGGLPRPTSPEAALRHRAALRFGWPAALGEIMVMASLRADILLVAALLGRAEAGYYAVAIALTELMWIVPDGASQVVFPMASAREPGAATGRLIRRALGVQVLAGLAIIGAGPVAIDLLFGSEFEPATGPLPLLVVAAFGLGTWKLVAADVVGRGDTRARGASTVVGLVAMLAADAVLIPALGLPGAALGAAAGYWSAAGIVLWSWRSSTGQVLVPLRRRDAPGDAT